MPICAQCGEQNPDGAPRCVKCGIALGHQLRAAADAKRSRNGAVIRGLIWVGVVVVLLIVGPVVYRTAWGSYLQYKLKGAKQSAMKDCGGPLLNDTPQTQVDQFNKCMATNAEFTEAENAYNSFKKR